MTILVTGAAGFIGFHASRRLLARGERIVGLDSLTDYYDVALKRARLTELDRQAGFEFHRLDLADDDAVKRLVLETRPTRILHLAAQAGVRYSLDAPFAYTHSNVTGHLSVLEAARALGGDLAHLVYASSSSVYGERGGRFREDDALGEPVSLYAATKRADELMSSTYTHLYGLPQTGLRFFTVYGPWGRPDMAYFSFAEAMLRGETIRLFNEGRNQRDFTYIDDVIEPLVRVLDDAPGARHGVYNIGGSNPVETLDLVATLERALGVNAKTEPVPPQPGDVSYTCADVTRLERDYGCVPGTRLEEGIARFAQWFRSYRNS
ncbi:NAD-dependent epimerase/dehydratase family protein [Marinicauda algicola]|uniref:NAD-dependent epimerase/dehydratase family protein n=1 Tax=Marinicauda algicola TaxID=2029849 RepID=A0A4S2H3R9_9PROT|nr:NAD-dependent epimerase/dehydratase family protein [Marinicauda algicola]TGY90280.1 NAD-dependent epimerase/dehydratase family protein [Marinicauda algicola]